MLQGLWLSADGLIAQQYRQDVIANNLANVDTPGFKPDRVAFSERLNEARLRGALGDSHPAYLRSTGGLFSRAEYTDFKPGHVIPTQNPLDVALLGDGFLQVRTAEGEFFTRDGRLTTDIDGTVRHIASGGAVLTEQGRPLQIDLALREPLTIDSAGRVRQGSDIAGDLAIVDFQDRSELDKVGQNLFSADRARPTAGAASVKQGFVESSGVDPSTTLVEMIAASRAYEMGASMISLQDQTLGRVVNDVGRIG
ncbi:MAG TPA: flagellar hook-basal body protein [Phycisphaerae bacterium]|nr:flagellar hook-basal body protein [Phycisphaerae bacterium]